jgi:hypothetical protein
MQNSRDSSVWRTLAVAFGDGLAFGVGVTLTRSAARLAATRSGTSEPFPANTPLNHRAADAVLTAIDGQFIEIGGRIDRRLTELEGKIRTELDELDAQDHELAEGVEARIDALRGEIAQAVAAQRQSIDADMRALRAQMTAVHKEFAETLARLMDEQIVKTIDARLEALAEDLRGTIREEARLSGKDQQIAELRERVDNQERNVRNLVMALGQSCVKAVEQAAPSGSPDPPAPASSTVGGGDTPSENGVGPAMDADLPGFARARPRRPLWRPPIVSSFLLATGGLLLLHYV